MSKRRQKDIAAARHGMWLTMQKAGVLQSGHIKSGTRFTDRKKEKSKRACRKKISF